MIGIERLADQIRRRATQSPRLGYTVKFALTEDGVIRWDGTGTQPLAETSDGPADTTIRISEDNLEKLLAGELDPTLAYMTGKLKVEGSLGVAMKLTTLLGD
jgi:putative sterol carrier protein